MNKIVVTGYISDVKVETKNNDVETFFVKFSIADNMKNGKSQFFRCVYITKSLKQVDFIKAKKLEKKMFCVSGIFVSKQVEEECFFTIFVDDFSC